MLIWWKSFENSILCLCFRETSLKKCVWVKCIFINLWIINQTYDVMLRHASSQLLWPWNDLLCFDAPSTGFSHRLLCSSVGRNDGPEPRRNMDLGGRISGGQTVRLYQSVLNMLLRGSSVERSQLTKRSYISNATYTETYFVKHVSGNTLSTCAAHTLKSEENIWVVSSWGAASWSCKGLKTNTPMDLSLKLNFIYNF